MNSYRPTLKRAAITVAFLFLFAGCDSGGVDVSQLQNGQSEADVIAIMGNPSGRLMKGTRITLLYSGVKIELVDGKTTGLDSKFEARFKQAKKDRRTPPSILKALEYQPKYPALSQTVVLRDREGTPVDHSELVHLGKVTIIDFYAIWCPPCRRLAPHIEALADDDPDVVLKQINIRDWDTPITKKYNISSVPDVRVFDRNGRLMGQPSSDRNEIQRMVQEAKKR